ncbi:MAG TPA: beta-galactosidase [Xanthobacteraceae bacterium]
MIWQQQTQPRLAGLAKLGITAGKIFGERGRLDAAKRKLQEAATFSALGLRFYIENIATDFYSAYHRWHPDHPVNWLFDEVQRLHRLRPDSINAFIRTPSLSDPKWLHQIAHRLRQHVRAYTSFHPLYYSLADEPGIADLSAAWDFDFAPISLTRMRIWLKQTYHTLKALNREWGTRFSSWHSVMPMTTDEALKRPDENFAAWADFKEWMDIAFARAARTGSDAVHHADPLARAALEGAQMPGWGGYDYSRLGGAVDVMELYDSGNNVEIVRSLFPKLITLMTVFRVDAEQIHLIWHELLLGARGFIMWDENNSLVDDDGAPTKKGQSLQELAKELRSGLGAQLIASDPVNDPVAILYSPESFRAQWLLDRKVDPKPWAERRSETEGEDNAVRVTMRNAAEMLTHLAIQPRWVTLPMIENGILRSAAVRVLILPHAIALSPKGARQIRAFTASGGVVIADSEPGIFDAHCRRLKKPLLRDLVSSSGPIIQLPGLTHDHAAADPGSLVQLRRIIEDRARIVPRVALSASNGQPLSNVDVRLLHNGRVTIVGLQRASADGNLSTSQKIEVGLAAPAYIYDLRRPGFSQYASHIEVTLDSVVPTLLALSPRPLSSISIKGPTRMRRGTARWFAIATATNTTGNRVVHVQLIAPDGTVVPGYTTNLVLRGRRLFWRLSFPENSLIGDWRIRLNDILGGRQMDQSIEVRAQ